MTCTLRRMSRIEGYQIPATGLLRQSYPYRSTVRRAVDPPRTAGSNIDGPVSLRIEDDKEKPNPVRGSVGEARNVVPRLSII